MLIASAFAASPQSSFASKAELNSLTFVTNPFGSFVPLGRRFVQNEIPAAVVHVNGRL